jgi:hypothetical protein
MSGRGDVRDVIVGVAEGATDGVTALRNADPAAQLEDFDVEVRYGDNGGPEVSVSIRFSIISAPRRPAGVAELAAG